MQPSDTHQMESTQPRHLTEGATISLDQLSNRSGLMTPSTRRGTRLRPPPALNPSATALLRVLRYRWLLALGLGLAAAVVVAALTWFIVPRAQDKYEAKALLIVAQRQGGPGGYRDPVDFNTYRRTQAKLATSLSLAKQSLTRPDIAAMLKEHKQDPDKVAREIQKNIKVEEGSQDFASQVLPVTLQWPNPEESVALVNGVSQQLVDDAALNEQADTRQRYALVEQNYKDTQKGIDNLSSNLHSLQEQQVGLASDDELQMRNEISLLQQNLSREELAYLKECSTSWKRG